jgi:hypothetical protein
MSEEKKKKCMVWIPCCGNKDCGLCHGMGGYWVHQPDPM